MSLTMSTLNQPGIMEVEESYIQPNTRPSYLDNGYQSPESPEDFDLRVKKKLSEEFANSEDQDRIKTFLRIRPPLTKIVIPPTTEKVFIVENPSTLVVRPPQKKNYVNDISESRFTYSQVFDEDTTQAVVFNSCVRDILNGCLEGGNGLIFSYGATNSGKTYTMQGYGKDFGIVPRTLEQLFCALEDSLYKKGDIKPHQFNSYVILDASGKDVAAKTKARVLREAKIKPIDINSFVESFIRSSSSLCSSDVNQPAGVPILASSSSKSGSSDSTLPDKNTLYSIWVSFAEIYNERVYDLFDTVKKGRRRRELKIFQDKRNQVYIKDLTECYVNTAEEAYQFFLAGKQNLQFATTQMNSNSSRSHCFFNVRMVAIGKVGFNLYPKEVFRLSFCDLAGLERVSQTGNFGNRLKESGNINQSLLVLLRCIRALRDQQKGAKLAEVIPFRDSKLTRLFQSYLTSATRICMIVNINPDPTMIDSTIQVIQNSAIASAIRTFKKIEPPQLNSAFALRVRKSIGQLSKLESQSEDEDSDDDSPVQVTTVKRQPINFLVERNAELEAEKRVLERKLRFIEDDTREKVATEFEKLLVGQRAYYEKLVASERKHLEEFGQRRLSLALQGITAGFLDDVRNSVNDNGSPTSDIDSETSDNTGTGSQTIFATPNGSQKSEEAPNSIASPNFDLESKYRKALADVRYYRNENEELMETIKAVQDVNSDKNKKLEQAESERQTLISRLATVESEMNHLKSSNQAMSGEITYLRAQDANGRQEELINELKLLKDKVAEKEAKIKDLGKETMLLNEKLLKNEANIEELGKETKDAEELCCDYHKRLEAANLEIERLTQELNTLSHSNLTMKQDEEMLHMLIDDLKAENERLKAKEKPLSPLQVSRVGGSFTPSPGRNSDRPRRVIAKYSIPSSRRTSRAPKRAS